MALCNYGHCLALNEEFGQAAIIQEQAYILFKDVLGDLQGQVGVVFSGDVGAAERGANVFNVVYINACRATDIGSHTSTPFQARAYSELGAAFANTGAFDSALTAFLKVDGWYSCHQIAGAAAAHRV